MTCAGWPTQAYASISAALALYVGLSVSAHAQAVVAQPPPLPAAAPVKTTTIPITPRATPRPPAAAAAPIAADAEQIGGDTRMTRFVIGLDKSVQYQVFSLSSPNRVIVELPEAELQLPVANDKPVGLVKAFRGGLSAPGRNRIVIDVTEPVIVAQAKIEKAKDGRARLVLEIVPVEGDGRTPQKSKKPLTYAAAGLGVGMVQPPTPRPALSPKEKKEKDARAFKPIIVIDPGHGGHDSGASKFGTVEKDVVLAFSLMLRDKLMATGRYQVLMTRSTDVFIPLDDRREFGEKHKAALFIAVHADYAGTSARGATIYSLRESVANDLKRSAKGEVSANVLTSQEMAALRQNDSDVSAVKNILADLAQREVDTTKDRTSMFTRTVIEYMGAATPMRDDPDKSATFRVLKTAQLPSVLIELAYVSNQQDARNLKSDEWRQKVSESLLTAIENYFSNQLTRLPM